MDWPQNSLIAVSVLYTLNVNGLDLQKEWRVAGKQAKWLIQGNFYCISKPEVSSELFSGYLYS